MAGGYTGKILVVNISSGLLKVETLDDEIYHNFIVGYGLGARLGSG